MIRYIHSSTVMVRDQDTALDFYTNVLGFEKREDSPFGEGSRWLTVAPPGEKSAIALLRPQDVGRPAESQVGGPTGISLVASDVKQTYEELSAKGVQFQGPPQQMPWGSWATWFNDPDGNNYFLTEWQG